MAFTNKYISFGNKFVGHTADEVFDKIYEFKQVLYDELTPTFDKFNLIFVVQAVPEISKIYSENFSHFSCTYYIHYELQLQNLSAAQVLDFYTTTRNIVENAWEKYSKKMIDQFDSTTLSDKDKEYFNLYAQDGKYYNLYDWMKV